MTLPSFFALGKNFRYCMQKTETFCILYWTHLSACGIMIQSSENRSVSFPQIPACFSVENHNVQIRFDAIVFHRRNRLIVPCFKEELLMCCDCKGPRSDLSLLKSVLEE